MRIVKITGNDCGGFRPPKGHLDTQMFPECEPYETNRDIVRKTVERRKKKRKHTNCTENKCVVSEIQQPSNWYKKATEDSPEFSGDFSLSRKEMINPSLREKIIRYFKESHPGITATFEEMQDWFRKNFTRTTDMEKLREKGRTPRRDF